MNNGKQNAAALLAHCHGVFSPTSYNTVGTSENPATYVSNPETSHGTSGKQFSVEGSKSGRTVDTYFEKKLPWVSDGAEYTDRLKYRDSQPTTSKGFLTSDFSRRDEFSMDFRTRQYREQLKMEAKHAKRAIASGASESAAVEADAAAAHAENSVTGADELSDPFLQELAFEQVGMYNKSLSASSKGIRDTRNRTALSTERELGSYQTTSAFMHGAPGPASRPAFPHVSVIEATFYQRSGADQLTHDSGIQK